MSSISSDLYEAILKPNKSHTNRIIHIVRCKTAYNPAISQFKNLKVRVFRDTGLEQEIRVLLTLILIAGDFQQKLIREIKETFFWTILVSFWTNLAKWELSPNFKVHQLFTLIKPYRHTQKSEIPMSRFIKCVSNVRLGRLWFKGCRETRLTKRFKYGFFTWAYFAWFFFGKFIQRITGHCMTNYKRVEHLLTTTNCREIVWVCLTILWCLYLKG